MSKTEERRPVRCSFCGKAQDEVERIIAGRNAFICDECIKLCVDIIGAEDEAASSRLLDDLRCIYRLFTSARQTIAAIIVKIRFMIRYCL